MATETVRRGFCSVCGSNLFREPLGHDWIGVSMGAFEHPTGTALGLHIYTENKGDYDELRFDRPVYPGVQRRRWRMSLKRLVLIGLNTVRPATAKG